MVTFVTIYKKYWPSIIAAIALLVASILSYIAILKMNDGVFVYALDDAYIHMAMAKNMALHGVWGVTRYGFSSSSSSLLWTSLLAFIFKIAQMGEVRWIWEYVPFVLNVVFGIFTLFVAQRCVELFVKNKTFIFVVLVSLIIMVPIPIQIVSGMEHTMHIFFTLWFLTVFIKRVYVERVDNWSLWMYVIAAGMTITRYEGFFVISACIVLLLIRRRFKIAVMLGIFSAFPHLVYGIISYTKGWYLVPHTLLIKSGIGTAPDFWGRIISIIGDINVRIFEKQLLFVFLLLCILFFFTRSVLTSKEANNLYHATTIFLMSAFLHISFARIGWLFRYEAYILTFGIVLLSCFTYKFATNYIQKVKKMKFSFVDIVIVAALVETYLLFIPRIQIAYWAIPESSKSIYDQHYQMGTFIKRYYNDASIAATDIGAIVYMSDVHLVDLLGLGDRELGKRLVSGTYTIDYITERVDEDDVALFFVYDTFFEKYFGIPIGQVPWQLVGEWRIRGDNLTARAAVSIFAVSPEGIPDLRRALIEYNSYLPYNIEAIVY